VQHLHHVLLKVFPQVRCRRTFIDFLYNDLLWYSELVNDLAHSLNLRRNEPLEFTYLDQCIIKVILTRFEQQHLIVSLQHLNMLLPLALELLNFILKLLELIAYLVIQPSHLSQSTI
jgi:hypothetical protein